MRWRFDGFELDDTEGPLSRRGRVVPAQPKVLELLRHLIRHRDRVVSPPELLEAVWPGVVVSPSALATAVRKTRACVGDDGANQRIIRTVRRRGFRFAADVRTRDDVSTVRSPSSSSIRDTSATNGGRRTPTVIVLPFEQLGGDFEDHEFLGNGIAEELSLALSRFEGLRVVSSFSSRQVGSSAMAAGALADQTGARFVISGSVAKDDTGLRVRAMLRDPLSLELLWSDHFFCDLTASSLFAAQEKIARRVVARVADHNGVVVRRLYGEIQRTNAREYSTYTAVMRFHYNQLTHTRESVEEARRALAAATQAEPNYALTLAMLAELEADEYGVRGSRDPSVLTRAKRHAERAIALDGTCQQAHWAMAYIAYLSRNDVEFNVSAERALGLNPNNAYLTGLIGWCRALMGRWEEGLLLLTRGIELNPYCPGWFHLAFFLDSYRRGEYEEGLIAAKKVGLAHLPHEWAIRIAALHRLGRADEARESAARLVETLPETREQLPLYLDALIYDRDLSRRIVEDVMAVVATLA